MIKKYKITYQTIKKLHTVVISALSQDNAKRRFVGIYGGMRNKKIVNIEEV